MPKDPDLFAILQGYGIPPGPFAQLLHQAVVGDWTIDELLGRLYGSPEFAQMFPGIFGPSGELIMSPGEYLAARRQYQHVAQMYGFTLDNETFGRLIQGGVSSQEYLDRLEAAARVSENPHYYRAYEHWAKKAGIRPSKRGVFDALLGLGPDEFYDLWEKTSIEALAKTSGLNLSDRLVRKIQRASGVRITDSPETKAAFEQLAQKVRTLMPLSQLYRFGITKSDLIQLEFGGPRQQEVAERVQRVLATHEAFREGARAQQAIYQQGDRLAITASQKERPQSP